MLPAHGTHSEDKPGQELHSWRNLRNQNQEGTCWVHIPLHSWGAQKQDSSVSCGGAPGGA